MFNLLKSRDVEGSAVSLSQSYIRTNMVDPLIQRRGHLCNQAKTIDNKLDLQAALEFTMGKVIPLSGGGRVKGGLKVNTGKEQMIRVCISAWSVIRVLKKHN